MAGAATARPLAARGARGDTSGPAVAAARPPRRPLRVAYCLNHMAAAGGTEMNAIRTATALPRDAVELTVFAMDPDGPMRARYEALGIAVRRTPRVRTFAAVSTYAHAWQFGGELARGDFDVVHCHDVYSNWFCGLAARRAGLPLLTSKRWTVSSRALGLVNRLAYRLSDRVLANSREVGVSLTRDDAVPAARVAVVPNFVEDDAFDAPTPEVRAALRRTLLGESRGAITLGCVARLRPEKGHRLLITAFAAVVREGVDARLVLVGDGPDEAALRAECRRLDVVDRVCFAGHQPNRPNPNWAFDIAVLASHHEGFPNALVEAMAAGRPVVATAVGGVPDAVTHDRTGLLVPAGDGEALAASLRLLVHDAERRARMGAAARAEASARFRAEHAVGSLLRLYDDVAARRRVTT